MAIYYEIIPRYTGGSPGVVDKDIALKVAKQETDAFNAYFEGAYGEEGIQLAGKYGLEGIVLRSNNGRHVDVITDRDYGKMPYGAIRYPEKLYVHRYNTRTEIYYYQLQKLIELPKGKTSETNMMQVLTALQQIFKIDIYNTESNDLWKNRVTL